MTIRREFSKPLWFVEQVCSASCLVDGSVWLRKDCLYAIRCFEVPGKVWGFENGLLTAAALADAHLGYPS